MSSEIDGDSVLGRILDQKYQILRFIEAGGMGEVFEARDVRDGRRLAAKLLQTKYVTDDSVLQRFERELKIASSLRHENIVELVDKGSTPEGRPYLIMEFLDGRNLNEIVRTEGPMASERAADLLSQALSAVQAAHEAGVIHRDLKPENIFVIDESGRRDFVKLIDFGLSKLLAREAEAVSGLTHAGLILGTPYYTAPEQLLDAKSASVRSDVYSMGVILYQLLTGRRPFEGRNYNSLLVQILTRTPRSAALINPEISEDMLEIIDIAMAREPAERFGNCAAFRERLIPYLSSQLDGAELETERDPTAELNSGPSEKPAARKYDAVFIDLWPADANVTTHDGRLISILTIQDVQSLSSVLADFFPRLIVSTATIDLDRIQQEFPDFRSPVVLIDLNDTHNELGIHEWDGDAGRYSVRRDSFAELDVVINELCTTGEVIYAPREEIDDIRLSNAVEVGDESYLVETKVLAGEAIEIITEIRCHGSVVDRVVQEMQALGEDFTDLVSVIAHTQHSASLDEAQEGKFTKGSK